MAIRQTIVTCTLVLACACSGGGGSSSSTPVVPWEKFRHDSSNTALGSGNVGNSAAIKRSVRIDPDDVAASPVVGSPAIAQDGTVYVGSEGGTFAAVNPTALVTPAPMRTPPARLRQCFYTPTANLHACASGRPLGPLTSSPAVYTLDGTTSIFVGTAASESMTIGNGGAVFAFSGGSESLSCQFCFQAIPADFRAGTTVIRASFVSSPTFVTNSVLLTVDSIFIGASVDVEAEGSHRSVGKLYAINGNGTLKWQFPAAGEPDIPPITSSPVLGVGNTLYFTTDDGEIDGQNVRGTLYALAGGGSMKWSFPLGELRDSRVAFAASPVSSGIALYAATADGTLVAVNTDGTRRWSVSVGETSERVVGSLALGGQEVLTLTPTPTPAQNTTPAVGGSPTPTATPIPFLTNQVLFGVTGTGKVFAFDAVLGTSLPPTPAGVGTVLGSPALSADNFIVVATAKGLLYALDVTTGAPPPTPTGTPSPSVWPITLVDLSGCSDGSAAQKCVRSSPSIGGDGSIYVGADDGMLYAVSPK